MVDSSIHPRKAVAEKYRNHVKKLSFSTTISSGANSFETRLHVPMGNKKTKRSYNDESPHPMLQYFLL
jgi:hypothetical protein